MIQWPQSVPAQRIEQFQAELLNLKSLMHPYVVGLKEV